MRIVEALRISGRGLVVVTDSRLRGVSNHSAIPQTGAQVRFLTPDGTHLESTVRSVELFSSPPNPDKPLAFGVLEGIGKAELPPNTQVSFAGERMRDEWLLLNLLLQRTASPSAELAR